jgi:alpha-beta hydrolase superfamily lysophospholipase
VTRRAAPIALTLALTACLSACSERLPNPPDGSRRVSIRTADGERLDAVELGEGSDVAILSHGATGTKEDLYPLASAFASAGWLAIAYDARGVGESTGARGEHRDADLRAVAEFARSGGSRSIVLVGGSLGASLSIAMADELDASAVVSLSAPADAFGAIDAAGELEVPVFVAAAADNEPFADDARALARALGVTATIVTGEGHGTGMLADHPDLIDRIVSFANDAVGI